MLSVNRIVRILGYGWVSTLSRRFGMRALTALAALGAALSTLAYGLFTGLIALLVARAPPFRCKRAPDPKYAHEEGNILRRPPHGRLRC